MPHLPSWIHVLPLTVGILTGCTTMVTTYDRIRTSLSEPDYDDTIHHYGAWFLAPSDSPRISKFCPKGGCYEIARRIPKEIRNIGPAAPKGLESSAQGLPWVSRNIDVSP
jgi:hypothetical protein